MSKGKKLVAAAVNAAIANGSPVIVEVLAAGDGQASPSMQAAVMQQSTVTPRMIAAVREYAAAPTKGKAHGWEFVSEFSDADISEVIEGALTVKTAIKKMSRKLYREVDPYGTFAKRAAAASVAA